MSCNVNTWALILGAADGSRLSGLTTTQGGVRIPKQFCSLQGGASLLRQAIRRAMTLTVATNICAVVVEHQRQWWEGSLWPLTEPNIVVQPTNKGTANGILLALLHILEYALRARVVLLPSDHHVEDEATLAKAIQTALDQLDAYSEDVILLGIEPNEPDTELGYIVPQPQDSPLLPKVARYIEKPPLSQASKLVDAGGLWNASIVVAHATTLLALFTKKMPSVVLQMQVALFRELRDENARADLYRRLPVKDFSSDVLQGAETKLRVLQVPRCGWNDLGTPRRVVEALRRSPYRFKKTQFAGGYLNLSEQQERLQSALEAARAI